MSLPLRRAPARLYRVHRSASPLELPAWSYAKVPTPSGQPNFGGRRDDPQPFAGARFRTLSFSSDPVGALVEVFQYLRPRTAATILRSRLSRAYVEQTRPPGVSYFEQDLAMTSSTAADERSYNYLSHAVCLALGTI